MTGTDDHVRHHDTVAVLMEVFDERVGQVDRGHERDRDAVQPLTHWAWLLGRRASDLACPIPAAVIDTPRRLLIEIAAIAVAAVESIDRSARCGSDDT